MHGKKTVMHWSSGKDAALALYHLQQGSGYQVDQLITTVNEHFDRVTMHGTPRTLLMKQVESLNMDHREVRLPQHASMEVYEERMRVVMEEAGKQGYTHAAFGDIFLEDLKAYRVKEMHRLGFETVFPLWKKDTRQLVHELVALGFKAVIVSANAQLGEEFLGRTIDEEMLKALPDGVDPCGEHGEFHTFCYDGPIFSHPVPFRLGSTTKRAYPSPSGNGSVDFWFIDLLE